MPKKKVADVRIRTRPDINPILRTQCNRCMNHFWYRPSMGLKVNNGTTESLKLKCGVCSGPHYVVIGRTALPVTHYGDRP
jgi:hypothetical protein